MSGSTKYCVTWFQIKAANVARAIWPLAADFLENPVVNFIAQQKGKDRFNLLVVGPATWTPRQTANFFMHQFKIEVSNYLKKHPDKQGMIDFPMLFKAHVWYAHLSGYATIPALTDIYEALKADESPVYIFGIKKDPSHPDGYSVYKTKMVYSPDRSSQARRLSGLLMYDYI